MQNRRQLLGNAAALGLGLSTITHALTASARVSTPEGFHHQDWFHPTSFDLRKDLKSAEKNKKNMVLLWEQKGCVYCRKMHSLVFTRKDIVDLINQHFLVVQMDMRGTREFIGLDGVNASEAEIARNYLVNSTPTTMFLDESGDITFKAPGYVPPPYFKAVYRYVIEHAYEDQPFLTWIKTQKIS